MTPPPRPTKEALRDAVHRSVPDVIVPGLDVLFCGINPGLYSGATGYHFARPGNRFWPALHGAGFTPRLLKPWENRVLLDYGLGITNLVARTTATAAELRREEFIDGYKLLERKVRRYRPRWLAVVGIGAYRMAFAQPRASVGLQERTIGATTVWLLPQPSGLNANHQLPQLVEVFGTLREAVRRSQP